MCHFGHILLLDGVNRVFRVSKETGNQKGSCRNPLAVISYMNFFNEISPLFAIISLPTLVRRCVDQNFALLRREYFDQSLIVQMNNKILVCCYRCNIDSLTHLQRLNNLSQFGNFPTRFLSKIDDFNRCA